MHPTVSRELQREEWQVHTLGRSRSGGRTVSLKVRMLGSKRSKECFVLPRAARPLRRGPGGDHEFLCCHLFSRTGGAEGRCDLLDGLGLGRADAASFLPVCRRDLVSKGQDEAPVAVEFFGCRLGGEQCDSASDVL